MDFQYHDVAAETCQRCHGDGEVFGRWLAGIGPYWVPCSSCHRRAIPKQVEDLRRREQQVPTLLKRTEPPITEPGR